MIIHGSDLKSILQLTAGHWTLWYYLYEFFIKFRYLENEHKPIDWKTFDFDVFFFFLFCLQYAVLLFLLLVAQIVMGVLVFTNKREVERVADRTIQRLWRERQSHPKFWDTIQETVCNIFFIRINQSSNEIKKKNLFIYLFLIFKIFK